MKREWLNRLKKKKTHIYAPMLFPGGSDCKESACNAGDLG